MVRKRAGACLWKLKAKGMVAELAQVGDYKGWRLVQHDNSRPPPLVG